MALNDDISSLYELYGFKKEYEEENIVVYLYEQGYFNNVEIVKNEGADEERINKLREDYIRGGYSVSVKDGQSKEAVERELFSGFFKVESSNKRVLYDYEDFCKMQTKKNGGIQYSYIPSVYTLNGRPCGEPITEVLYRFLSAKGSQLIILEAPAAFGKTCTSYEISKIVASKETDRVPILAELSKNRTAPIFDYVLYSEIDRKFTQLSSKLVTKKIVQGKIPLIIDGFDELLSKSSTDQAEDVEDVKSMLDTIANLFTGKSEAKVLLTSRKSAIFVGEIFDEWANQRLETCTINRLQILSPSISDWISQEKIAVLKNASIDLLPIANPALLSVLKNADISMFSEQFKEPSDILEYYIELVLNREVERQQLLISSSEQRIILQKLAAMMVQLDIISDEPEGIKALIEEIVEPNIKNYIKKYVDREALLEPTEEEFVMKLVHSAFLDRVKVNSNSIGFINEYIFGVFIGEAVINKYVSIKDVKGQFLSFAISAFASERLDRKDRFLDEIETIEDELNTEQKMLIDACLTRRMTYDYVDEYISDKLFDGSIDYNTEHYFYNCIFSGCVFKNVTFDDVLFEGCYFINCSFFDTKINRTDAGVNEYSSFVSCRGHEMFFAVIGEGEQIEDGVEVKNDNYYERVLLEQFWMPGSERIQWRKSYTTLFKGVDQRERREIDKAVERLCSRNILTKLTYCIELNRAEIKGVAKILGR